MSLFHPAQICTIFRDVSSDWRELSYVEPLPASGIQLLPRIFQFDQFIQAENKGLTFYEL
jgi:hypothetical protein